MAVVPGYVASAAITWTASATATATGASIGTASAGRVVVVGVTVEDNVTFSSCTIGGITATAGPQVTNTAGTPDNIAGFFYAQVPTGTTANIVVTCSGSISQTGRISVWATTGATLPHTSSNTNTATTGAVTLGSVVIKPNGAGYWVFNDATTGTATTWTNATGRDDTSVGNYRHSAADTTTSGTPTITATAASTNQCIVGMALDSLDPTAEWDQIQPIKQKAVSAKLAIATIAASGVIFCPLPPPVAAQPIVVEVTTSQVLTRTRFCQSMFLCPLPPPVAAQPIVVEVTTAQVQQRTLQYQSRFEVPQPSGVVVTTPSNLEWLQAFQGPPRRLLGLPGGQPFVPKEATVDNTTGLVWPLQTLGQVARPIPRPAQQGTHLFVPKEATSENTTNRVWPLTQGERARPIPRPAQPGGQPFVPKDAVLDNTVTPDAWMLAWQAAVPGRKPIHTQPFFGYPYIAASNARTEWDWTIQWQGPPRYWWQGRPYQPFVPREAVLDNTTNTVWPLTQGEKARPIQRPAQQGTHLFVPREATVDNTTGIVWPLTQAEKARPIGRPAPVGGQPFIPATATVDNTTVTVWPLAFGEKARPILRTAPQGGWFFGYPYVSADNNVTIDKWLQPLGKVVPIPRAAPPGGQPFIPKEAVLENTIRGVPWLQAWKGPPRYRPAKTQVTYPVQAIAFVDNTVTPDKWLQRWKGPPRYRPVHTQPTFLQRQAVVFGQDVFAEIELTVNLHVCGWGTEAQAAEAFVDEGQQGDTWSEQAQAAADIPCAFQADAFQNDAFQVCTVVTLQTDAWSEQAERDDDYDEQEECGR